MSGTDGCDPWIKVGVEKDTETKEVQEGNVVHVYTRTVTTEQYEGREYHAASSGMTLANPDTDLVNGQLSGEMRKSARRNPITGGTVYRKTNVEYGPWYHRGQYTVQEEPTTPTP